MYYLLLQYTYCIILRGVAQDLRPERDPGLGSRPATIPRGSS